MKLESRRETTQVTVVMSGSEGREMYASLYNLFEMNGLSLARDRVDFPALNSLYDFLDESGLSS